MATENERKSTEACVWAVDDLELIRLPFDLLRAAECDRIIERKRERERKSSVEKEREKGKRQKKHPHPLLTHAKFISSEKPVFHQLVFHFRSFNEIRTKFEHV